MASIPAEEWSSAEEQKAASVRNGGKTMWLIGTACVTLFQVTVDGNGTSRIEMNKRTDEALRTA